VKQILPTLFLFSFVFLFPKTIFSAPTISTGSVSSSIVADQELTVDVVLTCSGCGASYIRGVFFYPDSSPSYSGYTQNNSGAWINLSGSPSSYFKVESGSWNGKMKFKFDPDKPAGDYYFKVGRYTASGTSFSQSSDVSLIVVVGPSPSPTPTLSPTETPTSTPTTTPTPTSSKSTYKINSVKDSDGATLSNIKIYVDGGYTHHYAPESITFCAGCHCDDSNEVSCDLGSHTIKLVREGYADWSEQKTLNSGDNFEVNPILSKIIIEMTPTPSPTPVKTPTPTPSPAPTKTPTPTPSIKPLQGQALQVTPSTESSSVLGNSTDSANLVDSPVGAGLIPPESIPTSMETNPNRNVILKYTFVFGAILSTVSGGWLYFRHKKD